MQVTFQQFEFIRDNWQKLTLPQLVRGARLTRHKVIQTCVDNGFTPASARRNKTLNVLHTPSPRKIKSYKEFEQVPSKPIVRDRGHYTNHSPFSIASGG